MPASEIAPNACLYAVISNFSGAVLVEDEHGRIVLANEAFCRLFDFSQCAEKMLGHTRNEVMASIAERFAGAREFEARISALLTLQKPVTGEELAMRNGRVLERDYLPVRTGGRTIGHLWLFRDVTERKERELELLRLATTDPLTGVHNRRHFLEQLVQELSRMERFRKPAALLMMDLDHFKQINDRHGHATGDAVLTHFAGIARASLRKVDFIGRLGGEEFAVFLPGSDTNGALETAERLRQAVAQRPVPTCSGNIALTVSVGVTTVSIADLSPDSVLARADAAVYAAKSGGRNRVECIAPTGPGRLPA